MTILSDIMSMWTFESYVRISISIAIRSTIFAKNAPYLIEKVNLLYFCPICTWFSWIFTNWSTSLDKYMNIQLQYIALIGGVQLIMSKTTLIFSHNTTSTVTLWPHNDSVVFRMVCGQKVKRFDSNKLEH